jgi:hypothetical protein
MPAPSCATILGVSTFSLIITIHVRMVRPQGEVIFFGQREAQAKYDVACTVTSQRSQGCSCEDKVVDVKIELNVRYTFSTEPLN